MQVTVSATNMWVTIVNVIMQTGVSAVLYANDCFFCNYAGESFFYSYVGDSFKQELHIPFSNLQPLSIKTLCQVFTTFLNILPKLRYLEGRNYIQIG